MKKILYREDIIKACNGAEDRKAALIKLFGVEEVVVSNSPSSEDEEMDEETLSSEIERILNFCLEEEVDELPLEKSDDVEAFFSKPCLPPWQMNIASDLLDSDFVGEVVGIACEETQIYHVFEQNANFSEEMNTFYNSRGIILPESAFELCESGHVEIRGYDFLGSKKGDDWLFIRNNSEHSAMITIPFDIVTKLFSRNAGLLDSDVFKNKKALIIGCGSVGSFLTLEMTRAGINNFVLVDNDLLKLHNLCRHQAGIRDLGRYKVDVLKDGILNINWMAKVMAFRGWLEDVPEKYLRDLDIIISTGDNRECAALGCDLAMRFNIPFVACGLWERAHAGEVYYWLPDKGMLSYRQAFKNLVHEEKSEKRPMAHNLYFADEVSYDNINFEPGTSTDISFVTCVALKVIYDLLGQDSPKYTVRVLDYLSNYTLVCNTNKSELGGPMAAAFPHPFYISTNINLVG